MEAAILAMVLVAYNNGLNLWSRFHGWLYVPLNLILTTSVLLWAMTAGGLDRADIGLRSGQLPALGAGLLLGAAAASVLFVALCWQRTANAITDGRIAGSSKREVTYRAMVRVPLGTALTEEALFRGVLLGLIVDQGSVPAAVGSSAAFALWHIVPSVHLLRENRLLINRTPVIRAAMLAGATVLAFAAGIVLSAMRLVSGGLAAPLAFHATLNSLATVATYLGRRN